MKYLSIVIMLTLGFVLEAKAEIMQTRSAGIIISELQKADTDSLVIFDVQEVLFIAKDQVLQPLYKDIKALMAKNYTEAEWEELYSKVLVQYKVELVNPLLKEAIDNLQARNIKVIALTNGHTGKFGDIDDREDLRIQKLKELEIDFSISFPNLKQIKLDRKNHSLDDNIIFKDGIIFTSRQKKGEILNIFLDHLGFYPKKIIFIDNKIKNLLTVEEFCAKASIEYKGIQYIETINREKKPVDLGRVKFQFQYLKDHKIWLSDEDALKMKNKL